MNTIELTKNKVVKFLGKDPKMFTRADIIDYVVKNDIEMINFMYPAADGRLKTLNFIINDNAAFIPDRLDLGIFDRGE